jgi:cytochrome c-type biogenesis protein CcmH/NrfG
VALDSLNVQAYMLLAATYQAMGRSKAASAVYDKLDEVSAEIDRLVSKR